MEKLLSGPQIDPLSYMGISSALPSLPATFLPMCSVGDGEPPTPTPHLMWGLGGSRLLSSAARLVLPPPAPSPVQVRNALAIILLTTGLESMTELHQTCPAISHSPGSAPPPSKKGQVTLACTRPSQPPLSGLRFSFLFFFFFFWKCILLPPA